jgi:DNA gyrase subunit A
MPDQQELIPFARDVVDVPVADEMSESFLAYSLSVITSRAIPDVRDGLKPVQRRILYSMLQMGIRPDTPHRKSARVVGDTMGKYHPHGDSAIYETLVRMGQDFSRMITFVDPQGNFGSLDDPPAAPRYTECRLTDAAMEMVRELAEDTVEFRTTYDGEGDEPTVLPALLPNLLVNGTSGIAVGMATNMPTHNLAEIAKAIELVMTQRRPRPTVDQLLELVPGPDFPSGGIVIDDGIRDAYETGRGSIRMRATAQVEQVSRNRQGIVVTELPYMVGPERVIARIKELVNEGRLQGVGGVVNLSDRKSGLRLVVECKPAANPHAVLAELYRLTPLEETFGINNVVLVDGVPTTLGLADLCQHYVDHRLDVVVRRTRFRLAKAEARLHIVEGLLVALDAIDEVVRIIRGSEDTAQARERLMERFALSEIQTNAILEMPLRRLTALEKLKLEEEADQLRRDIADYTDILGSERRQRRIVLTELQEAVERFGVPRRTRILPAGEVPVVELPAATPATALVDQPCVVTLSASGQIGRVPAEGGNRGTPGRHDVLRASVLTRTTATIGVVTSEGRVLLATAGDLADAAGRARGVPAGPLLGGNRGEELLALVGPEQTEAVVLVTEQGVVKRVTAEEALGTRAGRTVIALRPGDRLVAAFGAPEGSEVALVASDAQALRTPVEQISVQGRGAGGVAGMKLRDGVRVVGAGPLLGDAVVVAVTTAAAAKVTPAEEVPSKGRGGQGVRLTRLGDRERVLFAYVGRLEGLLATMSTDDDRTKPDPNPVPFGVAPSRRDLVPTATERQVLALGPARW